MIAIKKLRRRLSLRQCLSPRLSQCLSKNLSQNLRQNLSRCLRLSLKNIKNELTLIIWRGWPRLRHH